MNKRKQPLVSVIVPTKDSAGTLAACLDSIKKQTYVHIELIVIDNKSSDQTKQIALHYTDFVYNKGPERSTQRNYGVKKGSGEYFLFIDSDMELSCDVITNCLSQIANVPLLQAIIIPEESFGKGFWAQCKKLERSFYVGVEWMEAPRFFTKSSFEKVNGFDESLCGPEDWDIYQRIIAIYGKKSIGRISSFIYHNEGNLSLLKTLQKKAYYMKKIIPYKNKIENKAAFILQGNIIARYMLFFKKPNKLFKNPFLGIGMLFMKTCEFVVATITYFIPLNKLFQ